VKAVRLNCWFSNFFCWRANPEGALVFVEVNDETREDGCGVYGDDDVDEDDEDVNELEY